MEMNIKLKILIEFPPQQQFIDRHIFLGVYKGNLLEVVISTVRWNVLFCFFKAHIMVLFLFSSQFFYYFSVAH